MSHKVVADITLRFFFGDEEGGNVDSYEVELSIVGEGAFPPAGKKQDAWIEANIQKWIQNNVSYEWELVSTGDEK